MTEAATPDSDRDATTSSRRRIRLHRLTPALVTDAAPETQDQPHDAGEPAYERLTWTSAILASGFGICSVVASWEASTPGSTWVEVGVRGGPTAADGPWVVLGRWAETDEAIRRTTVPGQDTDTYQVSADEITTAADHPWQHLQARVTLVRPAGTTNPWPSVDSLTVLTSGAIDHPGTDDTDPSGVEHAIDIPPRSQELYRDQDPELDGGGQSWCSPTAVTMVLEHWGVRLPQPAVPYAARHTYDLSYAGTGNWAFNTAFAARYGLTAFVTRLRSLAEAEAFTRAGIPLVLGVTFTAAQLDGAGYDTSGHLLALAGFDERGDPVVYDPASHHRPDDAEVRTTYRRDQFHSSWQQRGSGIAYVIHPAGRRLPPAPSEANW